MAKALEILVVLLELLVPYRCASILYPVSSRKALQSGALAQLERPRFLNKQCASASTLRQCRQCGVTLISPSFADKRDGH